MSSRVSGQCDRRAFLRAGALASAAYAAGAAGALRRVRAQDSGPGTVLGPEFEEHAGRALIGITLDLEMSRNFPRWEDTHWDYEKGNLNRPTKEYTLRAADRIAESGGPLHTFVVGRVFEQAGVEWLEQLIDDGHLIGNHTYDHVNVKATEADQIQFRFRAAPWLIGHRAPREVIVENVRLTETALDRRLGIRPAGFRTPGGFNNALHDRVDLQQMFLELGYPWVSSMYPAHKLSPAGETPGEDVFASIVEAQAAAQPFVYKSGLIEVPMSPISDITAFRGGRWQLEDFLTALDRALDWVIAHRAAFDFLGHPSCLYVVDPELKAIDLICRRVEQSDGAAVITDLSALARRAGSTT